MNARTKILAALSGSLGLMWMSPALAYSSYLQDVPNSGVYGCATCHRTSGGSGANSFYNELYPGSPNWSSDYSQDADGDGQTNGQELGDPCGSWSPGSTPQYTTGLSNPGVASDTNSIAACGGGGTTDTTPPTASVTSPGSGSTVSGTVTITVSASDNVGVTRVDIKVDGSTISSVNTPPYQATWGTGSVSNGSHSISADAYDAAGNMGSARSITVTVNNQTTDTTPPTASITAPNNGATVSGASVTLSANATDNVGVDHVDFVIDGTTVGSAQTIPWQYTWDSTTVSNGAHTFKVKAFDAAGNEGDSSAIGITVSNGGGGNDGGTGGGTDGGTGNGGGGPDVTAPQVALTAPSAGATLSGTAVPVSAAATDNVGVTRVDFLVDGAIVGSALTAPWSTTFDSTFFTDGSHTLTAQAYDAAGNQGTSPSINIQINNGSTTGGTGGNGGGPDGGNGGTGGSTDGGTGGGTDGGTGNPPQALGGCAVSPGQSSPAFLALFLLAGGLMVIRKRW